MRLNPRFLAISGFRWWLLAALGANVFPSAQAQIDSVTRLTANPRLYERVDFVVMLTGQWANPYRQEEARLDLDLAAPSGASVIVPGYFDKGRSGRLSVWRTRWTPVEAGHYTGRFVLSNGGNESVSSNISLTVTPTSDKGFLRAGDLWTFRFDNGLPFRGLGENVGWEPRSAGGARENLRYNYEYLLGRLAADGGNFFRTWMCSWNLPLEQRPPGAVDGYTNESHPFNDATMERMDQLVDLIQSLDLYMMLSLDAAVDFLGESWEHNVYNRKNGGAADTPQEFFTNPQAKAQYKNRLRYLVARWGYSPHLAAWEFFNEIDNLMYGLPKTIPDDVITSWHGEMSEYLKSIDPYHHFITTSISYRKVEGLNQIPSMDFNQLHIYGHNGTSRIGQIPDDLRRQTSLDHKPVVVGEYGYEWDWNKNFDSIASQLDAEFKKGLWLGAFSPTPILPMSWWWEFFDQRGVTPYLARVGRMTAAMLAAGGGSLAEADCKWDGAAVTKLAVHAGETDFVLLINNRNAPCAGTVTFPAGSNGRRVRVYHPEQDTTGNLPVLTDDGAVRVSVPVNDMIIVICGGHGDTP